MLLTAMERIFVLELISGHEDHYQSLKQLRVDREGLSISEEESKQIGAKLQPDGRLGFNPAAADTLVKDVPLSEYTTSLVRSKLSDMEGKGKLLDHYISIYEKFVIAYVARE